MTKYKDKNKKKSLPSSTGHGCTRDSVPRYRLRLVYIEYSIIFGILRGYSKLG